MMLATLLLAALPVAHYVVTPQLDREVLQVELTLEHWGGDCLCVDMERSNRAIRATPHPKQPACFARTPEVTRYEVDLRALSRIRNDPDYAADFEGAWLFHDAAVFLHPDEQDAELRVTFKLPPGVAVATPWPRTPGEPYSVSLQTYTVSPEQFDAGAYIALGRLRTLPMIELRTFKARVTLVDEKKSATDAQLRFWVENALKGLEVFYRGSPAKTELPLHIVLAAGGGDEAGVFGSVLRRGTPSVMLLYGREATRGFERDWVATHELFHMGNPPTQGRYPWLTEGFTTYYTELLRVRRGDRSAAEAWGTIATGARDFCQPNGTSLRERSEHLRTNFQWMRVYWSGACLALRLDVAIRQASGNSRSLDDVMRELREGPSLDEDGIIAALDKAAGSSLASTHLEATKTLPMEMLLKQLGVSVGRDELAKFDDSAPLAKLRQSMVR